MSMTTEQEIALRRCVDHLTEMALMAESNAVNHEMTGQGPKSEAAWQRARQYAADRDALSDLLKVKP